MVLDFVIPGYRDLKVGRFLFREQAAFFRARGLREVLVAEGEAGFNSYFVHMGFVHMNSGPEPFYQLSL